MTFSVSGSLVAIVTPMTEDGLLDLPAYEALIEWHIEQGPMPLSRWALAVSLLR